MTEIARVALFGKLNKVAYKAIEGATVFCKLRGNPYVELCHWLHQILLLQDSDLHRIINYFELDKAQLSNDLMAALDALPRGSTSISDLSSQVEETVERGWVYGSLMFGDSQVRVGHLLVGLCKTRALKNQLSSISQQFSKISVDQLTEQFGTIVQQSPEQGLGATDGFKAAAVPGEASGAVAPAAMGKGEALQRYTVNFTEQASKGELDPVVGRDDEIRQMIDILMRRRQNNPILTGEAGVGKTAVVEGFAQRIANGEVPPSLADVQLLALDVGLLQAGASMKGEFEERLKQVIEEVHSSEKPIILFVDEAHTLIGAGGAAGTGDAANLLKPALARGTLRTIAATTWAEYKKHIEKDPALTRRFQVVKVEEPEESKAILMMRGIVSKMEQHHRVIILDEAIQAGVKLAHRYIPDRQLPDKSVSLLDTTCARVAVSQHAVPAALEDTQRRVEALTSELDILAREKAMGLNVAKREEAVHSERELELQREEMLNNQWEQEKALAEQIFSVREKLRLTLGAVDQPTESYSAESQQESAQWREQLNGLQLELSELQGEVPLILPTVDEQAVAAVVQDWTGVPVGKMIKDEIVTILNLADILEQRIIGQRHALDMIARRIQTARAQLDNPGKPIGVFMLAGTSGVGKTETALALAETLYGGEQNLITINMSEYQEAHTVSSLKGAPPGYGGYGEGGVLTEAVRRRPYSVVLLDEIEKAHPDVHELFFQVFDKGWMEDGEGRIIDFKNTIILLTTNAGTDLIQGICDQPNNLPQPDEISKALREPLLQQFPAALLGRLVVIPYYPLSDSMLSAITKLQLARIEKRLQDNYGIPFAYSEEVVDLIIARCTEVESGGRMIDSILTNSILPPLSLEFLQRKMTDQPVSAVRLDVTAGEFSFDFASAAD